MTLRLRNHLAKLFNAQKKTKTDVFTNDRSMGKLFKEANRLKKVLSANVEHMAQVISPQSVLLNLVNSMFSESQILTLWNLINYTCMTFMYVVFFPK